MALEDSEEDTVRLLFNKYETQSRESQRKNQILLFSLLLITVCLWREGGEDGRVLISMKYFKSISMAIITERVQNLLTLREICISSGTLPRAQSH